MTSPRPLNFEAERDRDDSTSWARADPVAALIETQSDHSWAVTLPDSGDVHHVRLVFDNGVYVGGCTCDGYQYHEGPCAHLCTIRQADVVGDRDTQGDRIQIEHINRAVEDDLADSNDDTERARADGGRRVRR